MNTTLSTHSLPTLETVLAIDTSTSMLSLALLHQQKRYTFHQEVGNRQSEQILPQIHLLFAQAQITPRHLNSIIYSQGPGAFTGLRIGIGVAQGLSAPFNIPLIGVPSLDAVAFQVSKPYVLAATDARMGEVFYAWFDTINQRRLSDYSVGPIDHIHMPTQATQPFGIGNAFTLPHSLNLAFETHMPTAQNYLELGLSGNYPATSAQAAELLYVRNKIALTAREQAQRKAKQHQS